MYFYIILIFCILGNAKKEDEILKTQFSEAYDSGIKMNTIKQTTHLAKITNYPQQPVPMFKHVLERVKATTFPMNLATVDSEFGVINRSVMYRGLINDSWICFVTERNSRKYHNLKENPKLGLTMLFALDETASRDKSSGASDDKPKIESWQIRLLDAEAVELDENILQKLWLDEPLFAKVRSHICECGKPRDPQELEIRYKELLTVMEKENKEPEQTATYTAFKIIPKRWDFYKTEPDAIADRLHYKLIDNDQWEVYHVDA